MANQGEQRIPALDTTAVITYDEIAATIGYFYCDMSGAGIDGILDQLLNYAGRPDNNFTRSNAVYEKLWKYVNHWYSTRLGYRDPSRALPGIRLNTVIQRKVITMDGFVIRLASQHAFNLGSLQSFNAIQFT